MGLALNCAQCEKPLERGTREFKGDSGVRLDTSLWLAHLETDPFCSATCAREHHGATIVPAPTGARCAGCDRELSKYRSRGHLTLCGKCAYKERYHRKFFVQGMCGGCGGEMDAVTPGCFHCDERVKRRARRLSKSAVRPDALGDARVEQTIPGGAVSYQEVAAA